MQIPALSMDAGSCVPPGDHDNQIIELWSFECHRDNQHVRVHFQRDDHAVGGLDEATPQGSCGHFMESDEPMPVPDSGYVRAQAQDVRVQDMFDLFHCASAAVDSQQQCDVVPCATGSKPSKGARKRERDRNWTEGETAVLVECKRIAFNDKGSPFRKGKSKATNWEAISQELRNKPVTRASKKTGEQCRLRWDTLVKSHRLLKEQCVKKSKGFNELSEEELSELKLATSLNKEWYDVMDSISCKSKSQKGGGNLSTPSVSDFVNPERTENVPLAELVSSRNAATDPESQSLLQEGVSPVSSHNSPASNPSRQDPTGRLIRRTASQKQIGIPGFSTMRPQLRDTLLDLILGVGFLGGRYYDAGEIIEEDETLPLSCRWLSIVQNRSCSEICNDVNMLVKMKLVHISALGCGVSISQSHLRIFDKYVKKVILHNPFYNTHMRIRDQTTSTWTATLTDQIRVLKLEGCAELEAVSLRGLRKLRSLSIFDCPRLVQVTEWKYLRELGWLEINRCPAYEGHPDLPHLPSLKEFRFNRHCIRNEFPRGLNVSQCVRLRRLEVWYDAMLEDCGDLSQLKCLETLSFDGCFALSKISGLSDLHLLTSLSLKYCCALQTLPDIGHLQELVDIEINGTGLEEIPGVEKLLSLKRLQCVDSKLKRLPDLHHLPVLQSVNLSATPLMEDNQWTFYFGKEEAFFNREERVHVDVSDISDGEDSLLGVDASQSTL